MLSVVEKQHKSMSQTERETFDVRVLDINTVHAIEEKLFNIIENDKKLVKPVFLFVKDSVISKMAYFLAGFVSRPVSIGIAGATASGKSTFCFDIVDSVEDFEKEADLDKLVIRVNADDYYYDRTKEVAAAGGFSEFAKNYDFDVPEAIELDLLREHIEKLVMGQKVMLPKYDMGGTTKRYNNHTLAEPCPIIVSEGQYNLTDIVCNAFDFCIYVDVSEEEQKGRWYNRAKARNLTGETADKVYNNAISKAQVHVKPTKSNADIVINGEADREDYKAAMDEILGIFKESYVARLSVA